MQLEHAEHTLETIRTLMERSQRYEHLSGYSGLVAGGLTLAGCTVLARGWSPAEFAVVWAVVFVLAFAANAALTANRARQRGEPVWSRQARTVAVAVVPAFVASVAISVALARQHRLDELPSLWLLLYGCGAWSTSVFAPRSIAVLGLTCLTLGVTSLLVLPGWPLLTMAVGFGATHATLGICIVVAEHREKREQAFWAMLEELP